MQTFMPYSSIEKSVACLDNKRLGKQRVEALQIINALQNKTKGWKNHPATKMWANHIEALQYYKNCCIDEWVRRGFNNTMKKDEPCGPIIFPRWFGSGEFHESHRSNLLRKNPDHYKQFGWSAPDDLPYVWPAR